MLLLRIHVWLVAPSCLCPKIFVAQQMHCATTLDSLDASELGRTQLNLSTWALPKGSEPKYPGMAGTKC